jgi:uncharacterized membrane protein YebE (DUF533 family)
MDESILIRSVLGSVLGGRRRRRRLFSSPATLLTAAGLVWGVLETLKPPGGGPTSATAPPPRPGSGASGTGAAPPAVSEGAMRVVRLAVSAAGADGTIDAAERAAILEQATAAGVGGLVEAELSRPRPLAQIVGGVTEAAEKRALYVVAYGVVRGDEQPNGAERIYLAKLADLLGLEPAALPELERQAIQAL